MDFFSKKAPYYQPIEMLPAIIFKLTFRKSYRRGRNGQTSEGTDTTES